MGNKTFYGDGLSNTHTYVMSVFESELKPWPNKVASRRKLLLAMTCVHFDRDQICAQVEASFSMFGHQTQVNASVFCLLHVLNYRSIKTCVHLRVNLRVRLATQRKFVRKFMF